MSAGATPGEGAATCRRAKEGVNQAPTTFLDLVCRTTQLLLEQAAVSTSVSATPVSSKQ
jgi:hypothetical protein